MPTRRTTTTTTTTAATRAATQLAAVLLLATARAQPGGRPSRAAGAPAAVSYAGAGPFAAPVRGSIGTVDNPISADKTAIYGPFEAGFTAEQTSQFFGCSPGVAIPAGIDTLTAEKMVAHACGKDLAAVSVLDACGGHAKPYHYHERMTCLYEPDLATGHSTRIGTAADGNGIYGKFINGGVKPTDLDACGGRVGITPDSNGLETYYYSVQDVAPFTVGCLGGQGRTTPVSLAQCRALYDTCGDDDMMEVETEDGTFRYDPDCPCFEQTSTAHGIDNTGEPIAQKGESTADDLKKDDADGDDAEAEAEAEAEVEAEDEDEDESEAEAEAEAEAETEEAKAKAMAAEAEAKAEAAAAKAKAAKDAAEKADQEAKAAAAKVKQSKKNRAYKSKRNEMKGGKKGGKKAGKKRGKKGGTGKKGGKRGGRMLRGGKSRSAGRIAIIAGGSVAGLLAVIAVVAVVRRRRRNNNVQIPKVEEVFEAAAKEEQKHNGEEGAAAAELQVVSVEVFVDGTGTTP